MTVESKSDLIGFAPIDRDGNLNVDWLYLVAREREQEFVDKHNGVGGLTWVKFTNIINLEGPLRSAK